MKTIYTICTTNKKNRERLTAWIKPTYFFLEKDFCCLSFFFYDQCRNFTADNRPQWEHWHTFKHQRQQNWEIKDQSWISSASHHQVERISIGISRLKLDGEWGRCLMEWLDLFILLFVCSFNVKQVPLFAFLHICTESRIYLSFVIHLNSIFMHCRYQLKHPIYILLTRFWQSLSLAADQQLINFSQNVLICPTKWKRLCPENLVWALDFLIHEIFIFLRKKVTWLLFMHFQPYT